MAKLKSKKKKTNQSRQKPKNNFLSKFDRAAFKILLISGGILVSLLLFYSFFLPKDQFRQVKEKIFKNPQSLEARLELAEIYLENNQFKEAEKELGFLTEAIEELNDEQKVKLNKLWEIKRAKDPEEIRSEADNWQKIIDQYPEYRDGYLQLAILHLKLGEKEKASQALEKAAELAPNYQAAKELEEIIKN
jgi:Tfp pilus assembly protein PilF